MDTLLNLMNLDLFIFIFIIIVCIIGYMKGAILRLFDVLATVLSLYITYLFTHPVSKIIDIYKVEGPLSFLGDIVNTTFASLAVFVVCRLVFAIIGELIKPLLEWIVSLLKITRFIDRLLGVALSLVEGLMLLYIGLTLVYLPLFHDSYRHVGESKAASIIVQNVPIYIQNNLGSFDLENKDETTVKFVTNMLYKNYEHQLMDDAKIKQFMIDYYSDLNNVDVSTKQLEKLKEMCHYYEIGTNILKGLK